MYTFFSHFLKFIPLTRSDKFNHRNMNKIIRLCSFKYLYNFTMFTNTMSNSR
uniref:Uncharacterized protein n=1 Tax=CrAss-like virus sp. ctYsL76 TaxID=2826826 RepID=A0A8S5QL04_9CAUD|nr:MAG TPA: hypothetical protein [CrAss-like virus sp. ctYsL76]